MYQIKIDVSKIDKNIKCWFDLYRNLGINPNDYTMPDKDLNGSEIQRFDTDRFRMNQKTLEKIQDILSNNNCYRRKDMIKLLRCQSSFDFISYSPRTDDSVEDDILIIN